MGYFHIMKVGTEIIIEQGLADRFIRASQLNRLITGNPERRYGLVNRALKSGELLRLQRGLYVLADRYKHHDARLRFPAYAVDARKRAGEMPPGCDCASVVLGKIYPNQCRLYGKACVPRNPIGPCMVSDEGACRIWWANGLRETNDASRTRENS